MASNSLKADLALESKSRCYLRHQENFLPQNRFGTLQFKHFRVLLLKKKKNKPTKHFAGEKGRDE